MLNFLIFMLVIITISYFCGKREEKKEKANKRRVKSVEKKEIPTEVKIKKHLDKIKKTLEDKTTITGLLKILPSGFLYLCDDGSFWYSHDPLSKDWNEVLGSMDNVESLLSKEEKAEFIEHVIKKHLDGKLTDKNIERVKTDPILHGCYIDYICDKLIENFGNDNDYDYHRLNISVDDAIGPKAWCIERNEDEAYIIEEAWKKYDNYDYIKAFYD